MCASRRGQRFHFRRWSSGFMMVQCARLPRQDRVPDRRRAAPYCAKPTFAFLGPSEAGGNGGSRTIQRVDTRKLLIVRRARTPKGYHCRQEKAFAIVHRSEKEGWTWVYEESLDCRIKLGGNLDAGEPPSSPGLSDSSRA
jgi:hypothetical protein